MEMEKFKIKLSHSSPRRHLLVCVPATMKYTVIMGSKFLQLMKSTISSMQVVPTKIQPNYKELKFNLCTVEDMHGWIPDKNINANGLIAMKSAPGVRRSSHHFSN